MTDPVQRGRGEATADLPQIDYNALLERADGLKLLAEAYRLGATSAPLTLSKHTEQCIEIALMLGGAGFPEDIPIQDAVRQLIQERAAAGGRSHPEAHDTYESLLASWREQDVALQAIWGAFGIDGDPNPSHVGGVPGDIAERVQKALAGRER